MKKFLLFMFGVLIALPGIAQNFTYEYEGQTLTYTVIDKNAMTCKTRDGYYDVYQRPGNRVSGALVIPSVAKDGDIEYTVTAIGEKAFYECTGLTSVTIPESVITIGADAFYRNGLTSVTIPESVTAIDTGAFSSCFGLTSVTIPTSITSIRNNVFSDCVGLTSVSIPNSVTSIGTKAFYNCNQLTSVAVPNSVTSIGTEAFYDCSDLTTVTIGNSVTSIGKNAFYNCYDLTTVIIPNSVTSIGKNAFYNCHLKKSAYPSGLSNPFPCGTAVEYPREGAIIEDGFVFGPEKKAIYFAPLSLEGEYIIPESVTEIGSKTFSECSRLTSMIIPESVTEIGERAFYNCNQLTSVTIPESVSSIGWYAFTNCVSLVSVTIPNSVTSIGYRVFEGCSGLTSVIIPNSVTEIDDYAFYNCTGLTSVIIGNSVTKIGQQAFYGCTGLKKSAYPSGLYNPFSYGTQKYGTPVPYPREGSIIEDGFVFGPEKKAIYFAPLSLEGEYIIPESVTEIGSETFYECSGLTSVTIPESVTEIGKYAFSECSGLTSVTIPESVISIGSSAFYGCSGLTSIAIPNSVTEIGSSAFYGCFGLTSVTIGNSVTSIWSETFSGCTALTEIILPPSVMQIYGSAFAGNNNLRTIIMGHNVKNIHEKAFDLCPAETVYITAQTPPNTRDGAFSYYYDTHRQLYVQGQKAADAYRYEFNLIHSFSIHLMDEPTEMKAEGNKTLTGKPGDTFQLKATLYPEDVTLPYVFWRSTNPDIATVDANGLVTLRADMSEVMAMAADDDTSANSCKIIAESLYADGPVAEFTVNNITSGIEDVIYDGGNESGDIDFSAPVEVYNLQGVKVAHSVENLANGIYIVRQGNNVRKIAVK